MRKFLCILLMLSIGIKTSFAGYAYGYYVPDVDANNITRFTKAIEMNVDPGWNDGATLHASFGKTSASGKTPLTFTYQLPGESSVTVKFNDVIYWSAAEFDYKGHHYEIALDAVPLLFQVTVDNDWTKIIQVYIDDKYNKEESPTIPTQWQKARTLYGAAKRAIGYNDGNIGTCTVKCGKANKKGMASVSLTITPINGKKTTYKSQKVDVTGSQVMVNWSGFSLTINGDTFSGSDGLSGGISVETADVGGLLYGGGEFCLSETPTTIDDKWVQYPEINVSEDTLETFTVAGKKWTFAKAAKMKWKACPPCRGGVCPTCGPGEWIVDTSKGKTNISGLKLTYNPKTGIFKGGYTLFTWSTGGKKYKANVNGVVINGIGYGEAVVKKPYTSWPIYIYFIVPHNAD